MAITQQDEKKKQAARTVQGQKCVYTVLYSFLTHTHTIGRIPDQVVFVQRILEENTK